MPFVQIETQQTPKLPDQSLFGAIIAQSAEREKAQSQQLFMERLDAYTAASKRNNEQQLEFALVGLLVLFGGIFVLSFVARKRKQIASSGEDAVVSALASAVRAKRKMSRFRDRLQSKVAEKLSAEASPIGPDEMTDEERRRRLSDIIGRPPQNPAE